MWTESSYRVAYNLQAFIGLTILLYYQFTIESTHVFLPTAYIEYAAIGISAGGLAIMIVCIFKYFKQLSGLQGERTEEILEVSGSHRLVRHPLYLGTFIFLTGLFLLFPLVKNLGTVLIIIIYTLIAIRFEERKLIAKFGKGYQDYQRKVPMILPGIK
jgi:protein-S-isoprenylcysteine O-methyltransferase Ste14